MTPPRSAAEVNQSIAKLLGYHVEINHTYGNDTYPDQYILFQPNGEMTEWDDGCGPDEPSVQFDSEQQAWQHAPDYWHDPRAVFAALPANDGHLYDVRVVAYLNGGFCAILDQDTPPKGIGMRWIGAIADTREAALALALLSMLEATVEGEYHRDKPGGF